MREIATIVRLQIQRSSLKTGEKPDRVYDPAPLLPVDRLAVSPDGALGASPNGAGGGGWLVDVHHRSHPLTKNEDGLHGVSVGFSSHYALMRDRFGAHITLGCAGENIIAEGAPGTIFDYAALAAGLAVLDPRGRERVRLRVLQVAHPCRPFTGWALGARVEPEVLKANLQFLDNGTRGFYCVGEGAGVVEIGDRLAVL